MSQSALTLTLIALTLQAPCLDPTCIDENTLLQPNAINETLPPLPIETTTNPLPEDTLPSTPNLQSLPVDTFLDASLPTTETTVPTPTSIPKAETLHLSTDTQNNPPSTPVSSETDEPPKGSYVVGEPVPSEHASPEQATTIQGVAIQETDTDRALLTALGVLILLGLYHRLTKQNALKHPTRQRILSLLEDIGGGLTTTQLADRLDVTYRTARHHASKLETFGLLCRINREGPEAWALPSQASNARIALPEPQQRILMVLREEGSLHLSAIARRLNIAKATAKHRLDRLLDSGLVRDEKVGPLRCFLLTREGTSRCRGDRSEEPVDGEMRRVDPVGVASDDLGNSLA